MKTRTRARKHRQPSLQRISLAAAVPLLGLLAIGCGARTNLPLSPVPPTPTTSAVLTAAEVKSIVEAAAAAVNVPLVIAVTDRSGYVLAVYNKANAPATATANLGVIAASDEVAVALARSSAFFSNDQAPVSTRTIRYLSASHFPPAISFTASGPLYGIENTNRGCGFFVQQTTIPSGEDPGVADGTYELSPQPSPGPAPEGDLIAETGSTQGGLTQVQVQSIVQNTIATANHTRAVLRLTVGTRTRFAIAVADLDGHLLALYRMPDATMFSIDVAGAKARNAVYFSTATGELNQVPTGTAVTTRTIGFGAQPLYPSGIDGSQTGPFFDLFQFDTANPCTQGHQPANPNQNGIIFFPGSLPLYLNGKLVGGLGVSGDGVDQDDWVAAGFQAPDNIRADQILIREVRLPYQKFPRNPED